MLEWQMLNGASHLANLADLADLTDLEDLASISYRRGVNNIIYGKYRRAVYVHRAEAIPGHRHHNNESSALVLPAK